MSAAARDRRAGRHRVAGGVRRRVRGGGGWAERGAGGPAPYRAGRYRLADGTHLSVAVARATRMGSLATAPIAASLVERLRPRCLAMCGICAGNPADVGLGDVIIADL